MTSWYLVGDFDCAVFLLRDPFGARAGGSVRESLARQKWVSVGVSKIHTFIRGFCSIRGVACGALSVE